MQAACANDAKTVLARGLGRATRHESRAFERKSERLKHEAHEAHEESKATDWNTEHTEHTEMAKG
jgi:hypothetical protein